MAEFRWILLAFGLLLIGGIWWWGGRRSAQAPGNAELRETTTIREPEFVAEPRERSAPSFEPLSIHAAEFDRIPDIDEPIMVDIEAADVADPAPRFAAPETREPPVLTRVAIAPPAPDSEPSEELREALAEHEPEPEPGAPWTSAALAPPKPAEGRPVPQPAAVAPTERASVAAEGTDRISTAAPLTPNTAEKQKIVSVRVCAAAETRWPGSALLAAFELNGLAYGRYQVFHRRHVDGRSLFCVASMTEPGTFDVAKMQAQEFKGVTLFAVLPGPVEALPTLDELLSAAGELAGALHGEVQDMRGVPMSVQRAAALRDEVARFQASLAVTGPA